jgi:2-iminobutanoate/2-iminopropanoate deaminase
MKFFAIALLLSVSLVSLTMLACGPCKRSAQTSRKIVTDQAPAPIGPFSQAVLSNKNNLLFISGNIAMDKVTGQVLTDTEESTKLIMNYLQAVLNEAGMDFSNVVKTNIYLMDMQDFTKVNAIYGSYFKEIEVLPARETVQVAGLPRGARVEISMIAAKN